ncbi:hypothetical protein QBC35DRAFT_541491 [Podospora australis]|uniref:Meiotically up-regulated gene 190 protein n=1 Tax=Podospora australis TaxID=1536484 RepID=A0AAN6WLI0_9PEZI|nr:hypothetical protein QBC35DRAFT_541491 [Podospora australis]
MDEFEEGTPRTARAHHGGPYTSKHPVPTVQRYKEHRADIKNRQDQTEQLPPEAQSELQDGTYENEQTESKPRRAYDSLKAIAKDEDHPDSNQNSQNGGPYPTGNRHTVSKSDLTPDKQNNDNDHVQANGNHDASGGKKKQKEKEKEEKSATEKAAASNDPKEKRKAMKKASSSKKGRKVTDPVTHLPIIIHDMTDKDLSYIEDDGDSEEGEREGDGWDKGYEGMRRNLFPPPSFEDTKRELMTVYRMAFIAAAAGMGLAGVLMLVAVTWWQGGNHTTSRSGWGWNQDRHRTPRHWPWIPALVIITTGTALFFFAWTVNIWLSRKVDEVFDDEVWDAARQDEIEKNESEEELPESVAWLNSIFASVWRLINPDLFASLVDTLEDVMQASLPKIVRMVSVDDMGQGSEGVRILGIRWLPTGKANQSVDSDGNITPNNQSEVDLNEQAKQDQDNEGMEAEEGDFLNLELGFSYRAMSSGKSIKSKTKNAHLYLKFYLPGGVAIPVWVELKGLVGIMRVRLQLTPDPPFFQLATFTFLGQPHTNLSCVPLSKHYSPNLMNIPLISSFVQSAIDASLAEYVAPKSLTLDIKDMMMGDDFKKDTLSRGVIAVHIKSARGFKQGDGGVGFLKEGSSDCYVTLSWGKFGKPLFSTRVLKKEQEPDWDEWAYVLVSPDEINAEENVRVQIWDSDKHTADDDLGRVEVTLKDLMKGQDTRNKMLDREDQLRGEDSDDKMPGTLTWSVGFFSKTHIQDCQLKNQTFDPSIRTKDALKEKVSNETRAKMREALGRDSDEDEFEQQKMQDYKDTEDKMIISAPPPQGFVSGILGVQIHNITGLEVAQLNRRSKDKHEDDDEKEERNLPDGYCTITLNHTQIYRTRTKPKNGNPFFNAGTEKFVKDWQTAEVMISVRDSREGENDPLLGVIFLPLSKIFAKQTQVMETFPIAGGIGYGKARISLVWRSVCLDLPKELRGWDWGTLEVKPPVSVQGLSEELKGDKLKFKTTISKAKMYWNDNDQGWRQKGRRGEESIHLAVKKRYASSVVIQFKDSSSSAVMGKDKKYPALAVLWLGDIPDEEDKTVRLNVWKGGKQQLKRARSCGSTYNGLEEGEQPLGEIELNVKFWRGLSGYHKKFSHKAGRKNIRNVMEILGVVDDEGMDDEDGSISSASSGSDSDSDSDSEPDEDEFLKTRRRVDSEKRKQLRKAGGESDSPSESDYDSERGNKKGIKNLPSRIKRKATSLMDGKNKIGTSDDDGERGVVSQLQDYKKNHKRLHRKHRGIMQWKAARTVDWVKDKAKEGKGKVEGLGRHGEKEVGIETEV